MRQLGFSACLFKPVRQSQLFDVIMESAALQIEPGSTLPISVPAPAAPESVNALPGTNHPPKLLGGIRVLLAEDNEVNQEIARELLVDAGCEVEIVCNGAQAVAMMQDHLRNRRYDVILMDCQMPELDGFEATERIRKLEQESSQGPAHIPIVALTANAVEGDREHCLAVGMDGYVTKPIDPDMLIETIQSLIRIEHEAAPVTLAERLRQPAGTLDNRPGTMTSTREEASDGGLPIHVESLLRRCRGKAPLAERLLAQFEEQLARQLSELTDSLERRDSAVLARLAHTVQGTAANMSATRLSEAAAALERLGIAGDFAAATNSLNQLAERVRQCRDDIPAAAQRIQELTLGDARVSNS